MILQSGLRFTKFQPIRQSVGQQHRVRAKRKRRRAYLQRRKAALRASAERLATAKQHSRRESAE